MRRCAAVFLADSEDFSEENLEKNRYFQEIFQCGDTGGMPD